MKSIAQRIMMLAAASLLVTTVAGAGAPASGSPTQHEVVFIGADNDWFSPPDYTGFVIYHTASAGAPPITDGENVAQTIADLLNMGYHIEPGLKDVLYNSTAFVK